MHTLLHWGSDAQKDDYLRRLCEGTAMSCFAMTEPEVAGSDPTLIQTHAEKDGDEWVINGHKWFISNARRAQFAILIARTEPDVSPGSSRREHGLPRRPAVRGLERRARGGDHARVDRSLRDRDRGSAHPRRPDPRRPGQRAPARAVPARSGTPGALHALDRPGRDRARHDGRPRAALGTHTVRFWPRSRACSGSSPIPPWSCTSASSWCCTPPTRSTGETTSGPRCPWPSTSWPTA